MSCAFELTGVAAITKPKSAIVDLLIMSFPPSQGQRTRRIVLMASPVMEPAFNYGCRQMNLAEICHRIERSMSQVGEVRTASRTSANASTKVRRSFSEGLAKTPTDVEAWSALVG